MASAGGLAQPERCAHARRAARPAAAWMRRSALIDEKGTTEFTIQEVVDRSKQSLRGFYQYFDGKDELLFALLEEIIRESLEDLHKAVESESKPLERLRAFTICLHEWCEPLGKGRKRGAHNRVPISEFSLQLAVKNPERLAAVMAPISRMLVELLDAAVAADAVKVSDTRRAALLIQQTVMYSWLMNRLVQNPRDARLGRGCLGVLLSRSAEADPTHEESRHRRSRSNADRPCAQGIAGRHRCICACPGGGASRARAHEDRAERDRRSRHRREPAGRRRHRTPYRRRAGSRSDSGVGDESTLRSRPRGRRDRSRIDRGRHGSRRRGGWDREHEHDAAVPEATRRPARPRSSGCRRLIRRPRTRRPST